MNFQEVLTLFEDQNYDHITNELGFLDILSRDPIKELIAIVEVDCKPSNKRIEKIAKLARRLTLDCIIENFHCNIDSITTPDSLYNEIVQMNEERISNNPRKFIRYPNSLEAIEKYKGKVDGFSRFGFFKIPTILSLVHYVKIKLLAGDSFFAMLPIIGLDDNITNQLFLKKNVGIEIFEGKLEVKWFRIKEGHSITVPPGQVYVRFDFQGSEFTFEKKFDDTANSRRMVKWLSEKQKTIVVGSFAVEVLLANQTLFEKNKGSLLILADDICTYFLFDVLLETPIQKFIRVFYDLFAVNEDECNEFRSFYNNPERTGIQIFDWIKDKVEIRLNYGVEFFVLLQKHLYRYLVFFNSKKVTIGHYGKDNGKSYFDVGCFAKFGLNPNEQMEEVYGFLVVSPNNVGFLWELNEFSVMKNPKSMNPVANGFLVGPQRLLNHSQRSNSMINDNFNFLISGSVAIGAELCIDYSCINDPKKLKTASLEPLRFFTNRNASDATIVEHSTIIRPIPLKMNRTPFQGKSLEETEPGIDILNSLKDSRNVTFLVGAGISAPVIKPFRTITSEGIHVNDSYKLMQ